MVQQAIYEGDTVDEL